MLPALSTNRRPAPTGAKVGTLLPLISCAIGAALWPCDAAFAESTPYVLNGWFAVGGNAGNYNGDYEAGLGAENRSAGLCKLSYRVV